MLPVSKGSLCYEDIWFQNDTTGTSQTQKQNTSDISAAETGGGKLVNSGWKWVFVCFPLLNLCSPHPSLTFPNTSHLRRTFLWPSAVESDDKDGTADLDIQHAKWLLLQSVSKQGQAGGQTIWASVRWTLMEGAEEDSPWRVQHCHDGRVIKIFHWLECWCIDGGPTPVTSTPPVWGFRFYPWSRPSLYSAIGGWLKLHWSCDRVFLCEGAFHGSRSPYRQKRIKCIETSKRKKDF